MCGSPLSAGLDSAAAWTQEDKRKPRALYNHFAPRSQVLFFFFKIYLFIHSERARERQRHRQREKQAPCWNPDVGLDPRSPGSHPGLQAALNRCATKAAPIFSLFVG